MKRLSSLPLMRRFFAVVLFVIGTVTASAQVYYMNVYQKDGSRSRFVVDNLDSVNFTFEQAPVEGLEYVDLGLSVKWATFNVGATSPYETGDFFSFGETEPKDSYTRSNYKYYEPDNLVKYTKYNFYTRYGIVDYKYRLDMEDDVARVKWGGDWRMPTIEEMEELVYNCYWEWTEINSSVYGYKVTGPNGNSIFLPAGYYRDDEDESTTPLTSYLSSTLSNEYPGHAIGIDFYDFDYYGSDYYDISPEGRYFGELIRPVYSFDTPDNVKELSYFNLKEQSLTLKVGERYALSFEMDSSFMFVPDIICKGDDCVQVNSNGLIDAFAPGTTTITVNLGNYSYECVVTVVEPMIVAEEVDLGLSVKWATCNLGAETPESYGYYYSWGETTPKTSYYQNSYKWYDNSLGYIKYSSYAENADDKWILDDEDDAARAYWGDNWRIPTNEEMEELIRNCSWEWIEGDGVAGYKVTSLVEGYTDNYIFLPNAGLRYYSNLYYNYDCGYYWTTSRKGEDRGCYLFSQLENNIYLGAGYRFYGRSIRPVRSFDASDIDSIVIDVERLQLNIDQNYTLSVHGISSSGRIIAVGGIEWESDNVNVATVDEKGVVTPVAEGSCTIKAVSNKTTVYCSVVVINPYQPQYVDLGLSVMWASFNIGARSPEEKGNYYAWGETEVKDYYDESTYKWYDSETESLTKYNLYAERGDVDLKYRLDPEDDVAHHDKF